MKFLTTLILLTLAPVMAMATGETPCGGSFSNFLKDLKAEAVEKGIAPDTADRFLSGIKQDQAVLMFTWCVS